MFIGIVQIVNVYYLLMLFCAALYRLVCKSFFFGCLRHGNFSQCWSEKQTQPCQNTISKAIPNVRQCVAKHHIWVRRSILVWHAEVFSSLHSNDFFLHGIYVYFPNHMCFFWHSQKCHWNMFTKCANQYLKYHIFLLVLVNKRVWTLNL